MCPRALRSGQIDAFSVDEQQGLKFRELALRRARLVLRAQKRVYEIVSYFAAQF